MPDFNQYTSTQDTFHPQGGNVGRYAPDVQVKDTKEPDPQNVLASIYADAAKKLPTATKSEKYNIPYLTPLDQTLRYTDPNIGFNPFDSQLEYKYADAHPFKNIGNNLLQGGARFLGAAIESIATIPIAINALAKGDFSKLYDNDTTKGINDWLDTLQTSLPVYTSQYEQEHPALKYLSVWKPGTLLNSWSGAVNNFGYTAGAIAGALVEDALITAVTGGTGLAPALATQASQFITKLSRGARAIVGAGAEAKNLVQGITRGSEILGEASEAAQATTRLANTANEVGQGTDSWYKYLKIRDGVKRELALLTSAAAEGAFEAADVYKRGKEELKQSFYDTYGRNPEGEEINKIENQAKGAGNFTMGMNIGLLYLSNRINWGSLFKPTETALKEGITGWGSNIARTSVKGGFDEAGTYAYKVVTESPASKIGKILLNAQKVGKIGFRSINESIEEGSQYMISEGSLDYIKNKYDANNLGQVGDFAKSFNNGLGKTFGTNEGWDNMIGGFIGGIFGGGIMEKIQHHTPLTQQIANQVQLLNKASFNGTLENRFKEAAVQSKLGQDHKEAILNGDVYKAKNIKFDMLFNWVATGVRANAYEKRMEELDSAKDLEGKSFTSYWGVEDTAQNRQAVNQFVNETKEKAEKIKKNVEKIDYLTKNPFNQQKDPLNFNNYENYKEALSKSLSQYDEYQSRYNSVIEDLKKAAPMLRTEDALDLVREGGFNNIKTKVEKALKDIDSQIKDASQISENDQITKDLKAKRQELVNISNHLSRFNENNGALNEHGEADIPALKSIFELFDGTDFINNKATDRATNSYMADKSEIWDDDFVDIINKLNDANKLNVTNYRTLKAYAYLRTPQGTKNFQEQLYQFIAQQSKEYIDAKTGQFQSTEQKTEEKRQEEQAKIDTKNATPEEVEQLKNAAKNEVAGRELTDKDKELTAKYPDVYTNFVKAEETATAPTATSTATTTPETKKDEPPKTVNNKQYKGITPQYLLTSIHRNTYVGGLIDRLHNLIFNSTKENFTKGLSVTIGNRNESARVNNITKIGETGIYRKDFGEFLELRKDGQIIGEIRPPSSLYLDLAGTQSIFDKEGNLVITPEQYTAITNNDIDTYNDFKASTEAYNKSYNSLLAETKQGKEVDYNTLSKHFSINVNTGSAVINPYEKRAKDTLYDKLPFNNKVVIFVKEITDLKGNKSYEAEIRRTDGSITKEQQEAIKDQVENNPEQFKKFGNKLMVVFPTMGEIAANSFVRARLKKGAKADANYNTNLYVTSPKEVFENFTLNLVPKTNTATEQTSKENKKADEKNNTNIDIVKTPSADIISKLNEFPDYSSKLEYLKSIGILQPIVVEGKSYNVIDYNDRIMVLMRIGKYNVPFYISTGQAGKKNVKAGEWYAVFGINSKTGWINKGSEDLINKQYDFPIFQKFAKILNEGVPKFDTRENNNNGKLYSDIGFLADEGTNIEEFNKQTNFPGEPVERGNPDKFYKRVTDILNAINEEIKNNQSTKTSSEATKEKTKTDSKNEEAEPKLDNPANTQGIQITPTLNEAGDVLTVPITNNGEVVGEIKAFNDGTYLTINDANVSTPRQGVGIEAYRQLAKWAKENGLQLRSDSINSRLSESAKGLWNKLVEAGEARLVNDNYIYDENSLEDIDEDNDPLTYEDELESISYKYASIKDEDVTTEKGGKGETLIIHKGIIIGTLVRKNGKWFEKDRKEVINADTNDLQGAIDDVIVTVNELNDKKYEYELNKIKVKYGQKEETPEIEDQVDEQEENDKEVEPEQTEEKQKALTVKDIEQIDDEGIIQLKHNGEVIAEIVQEYPDDENSAWIRADVPQSQTESLGESKQEAIQSIIDEYNKNNGLQTENKNSDEYVKFTRTTPEGVVKQIVGKVVESKKETANQKSGYKFVNTVEDQFGQQYEVAKSSISPATEEEYTGYTQEGIIRPIPKYQIGQRIVTTNGKKATIASVDFEQSPNTFNYNVVYKTEQGNKLNEDNIQDRYYSTGVEKGQEIQEKHEKYRKVISNIVGRFQKIFPQINVKIGYYEFDALARFNNGQIEVNFDYIDRKGDTNLNETIAHEFMHPFVLAMKISNKDLYNSLIAEIYANHKDLFNEIKNNGQFAANNQDLSKANLEDEALVIYLGRELNKGFNADGTTNIEYYTKSTLLQNFVRWIKDVVDFLTGKRKPKSLQDFVKSANADKATIKDTLKSLIENNDVIKEYLSKTKADRIDRKITQLLKGKEQLKNELSEEQFNTLYSTIESYKNDKDVANNKFEFIIQPTANNTVEFDTTNPNAVKVYIDPSLSNEYSIGDTLLRFGNKIDDNAIAEQYKSIVERNFYRNTEKAKSKNDAFNVSDLNPLMKLQDVTEFLQSNLDNTEQRQIDNILRNYNKEDENYSKEDAARLEYLRNQQASKVKIEYNPEQLSAIRELEAYMSVDPDKAPKIRDRILAKLKLLGDTANKRLNDDSLRAAYNTIKLRDLDNKDDVKFLIEYTQSGSIAINTAWDKYKDIKDLVEAKKGTFTATEVNDLSKNLAVVRQLLSFYDEFEGLTGRYNFDLTTKADKELYDKYNNDFRVLSSIKNGMQDAAINLVVEWFTPYINTHNEFIKKEGYTNDEYLLSPDKLYQHFKYGVGKDTSFITFWLGANVTSRNPVNAVFANTMADAVSFNNIDTSNDATNINVAFNNFIKKNNLSNKQQVEYYKANYMRQADVMQRIYDKKDPLGGYEDKYIKKWAIHRAYLYDQYQKDLDAIRKQYSEARDSKEDEENNDKIREFRLKNELGINTQTGELILSDKYKNKEYEKASKDEYFKTLEKYYLDSNARYGQNKLNFGLVPQQYDSNFLQKAKDLLTRTQQSDKIKDKITFISHKIKEDFGAKTDTKDQFNLDGSTYRQVGTSLTDNKDEENLNLNLHETLVNFVVESRNYSTMRETQFNAETLILLLEGNQKFNIEARKFSQIDISKKLKSQEQLDLAKIEIKKLDEAKNDGQKIDEDRYKKLQDLVLEGVKEKSVWDKFLPRLKPAKTNYNNDMLLGQIKDVYFGQATEQEKIGNFNLNKIAHALSLYTSINSMAGNVIGGIGNVNTGNLQLFIEAHGAKYFTKKDLAKATIDYLANIPKYVQDLQNPIKSKDTQLSILLDAIQGEIHDEFGVRVTGNIARRFFNIGSLFLLTSMGEHQIQLTGMKAMMYGRKVQTQDGKTISLYEAFTADKNGRFNLRTDLKDFGKDDLAKFIRDLHGVNRNLNGNYSEFNKTMLQRQWYGNLVLKFRKYLYPAFRARWASEHTDYERNTVEVGYLRSFGNYLYNGSKNLLEGKGGFLKTWKDAAPHEIYARKKAIAELGFAAALTILAFAIGGGDDKKELTTSEKAALLLMERLRADIGTFSFQLPAETVRQVKSPTASLTTVVTFGKLLQQLWNPGEVYTQDNGTHKEGDTKLGALVKKMIPLHSLYNMFNGNISKQIDENLGYFNSVNKGIKGVSPKQSN